MHDCYSGLLMDIYYSTSLSPISLYFSTVVLFRIWRGFTGGFMLTFFASVCSYQAMMMAVHCVGNFAAVVLLFLWFPVRRLWAGDKNMEIFFGGGLVMEFTAIPLPPSLCTSFPVFVSLSSFLIAFCCDFNSIFHDNLYTETTQWGFFSF